MLCDLAGTRTQDPLLKREMLYQLSYQVCNYAFANAGANIPTLIYFSRRNWYKFVNSIKCYLLNLKIKYLLMKILLCGYMGSGKSTVGAILAAKLKIPFFDLDAEIEKSEKAQIPNIFKQKGEIFFRKKENQLLREFLKSENNFILALGGGTPCYGNNLELIQRDTEAKLVYLKYSVEKLTSRLFKEKSKRPLINHLQNREDLEEFVRKHLFERSFYYNRSDIIINCENLDAVMATEKIIEELN